MGDRADAARPRRRPGPRSVLRPIPLRSADRALGPVGAGPAGRRQAGAVRGARLGDLRAADRVQSRSGDPAPADRTARAPVRGERDARFAYGRCACGPGAGAARVDGSVRGARTDAGPGRPRGGERARRPARPRPRERVAATPRDPGHRQLDARDAGLDRPGPSRSAALRGRRVPQARRSAARRRRSVGPRHRGRGRRVLRPVRAVGRVGGPARLARRGGSALSRVAA